MDRVTFLNKGNTVVGNLFKPADFDEGRTYPAIVVTHPFGAVKEQVSTLYAEKLTEQGYITLAFDASYQGESGGEPHFSEIPAARVEDIRCAVDFLGSHPLVDESRIGALGICAGGGYTVNAAQTELRIKAVATRSYWRRSSAWSRTRTVTTACRAWPTAARRTSAPRSRAPSGGSAPTTSTCTTSTGSTRTPRSRTPSAPSPSWSLDADPGRRGRLLPTRVGVRRSPAPGGSPASVGGIWAHRARR